MVFKPEEVSKNIKKTKVSEVFKPRPSQSLVCLRPPQVLARFSVKIVLKR